jgi:hypothetical protein
MVGSVPFPLTLFGYLMGLEFLYLFKEVGPSLNLNGILF